MTIEELRAFLDKEEEKWTDQDIEYMGEFKHQHILLPHFTRGTPTEFKGWDHEIQIWYDITGMGYLMDVKHE